MRFEYINSIEDLLGKENYNVFFVPFVTSSTKCSTKLGTKEIVGSIVRIPKWIITDKTKYFEITDQNKDIFELKEFKLPELVVNPNEYFEFWKRKKLNKSSSS